jgi:hypothetical protein
MPVEFWYESQNEIQKEEVDVGGKMTLNKS